MWMDHVKEDDYPGTLSEHFSVSNIRSVGLSPFHVFSLHFGAHEIIQTKHSRSCNVVCCMGINCMQWGASIISHIATYCLLIQTVWVWQTTQCKHCNKMTIILPKFVLLLQIQCYNTHNGSTSLNKLGCYPFSSTFSSLSLSLSLSLCIC